MEGHFQEGTKKTLQNITKFQRLTPRRSHNSAAVRQSTRPMSGIAEVTGNSGNHPLRMTPRGFHADCHRQVSRKERVRKVQNAYEGQCYTLLRSWLAEMHTFTPWCEPVWYLFQGPTWKMQGQRGVGGMGATLNSDQGHKTTGRPQHDSSVSYQGNRSFQA